MALSTTAASKVGPERSASGEIFVSVISLAPVKSLGLVEVEEVELTDTRVVGDREFFLVDSDNRLFVGSRFGSLVSIRPELRGDSLSLTFPDGAYVSGDVEIGPSVETPFYSFRVVNGNEVLGPWSQALSGFVGEPVRLIRASAGDGFDLTPVSILSSASIERLGDEVREPVDRRRFRMVLQFDGCEAHAEDTWTRIQVGEAVLRVGSQLGGPIPRCVVITNDPDTGQRDLDALRLIKRYRGQTPDGIVFGVYASIEKPGRVRIGDSVVASTL
jgi:MOSC domain-containing protein